jgi:hypothetical protein
MTTYIVAEEITITRQEGDHADVTIVVPASLSMVSATAKFQVNSAKGTLIFLKSSATTGLDINAQTITVTILPADTKGKSGTHRWELEITNSASKIITAGRGDFEIIKEEII